MEEGASFKALVFFWETAWRHITEGNATKPLTTHDLSPKSNINEQPQYNPNGSELIPLLQQKNVMFGGSSDFQCR
jgi:hypothetical protein